MFLISGCSVQLTSLLVNFSSPGKFLWATDNVFKVQPTGHMFETSEFESFALFIMTDKEFAALVHQSFLFGRSLVEPGLFSN